MKKRVTSLLVCLVVAGSWSPVMAQDGSGLSARVFDTGSFQETGPCRKIPDSRMATGYVMQCDDKEFISGNRVNLETAKSFGFRYLVEGLGYGECVTLTHKVTHPPLASPGKQKISSQSRSFSVCGRDANHLGNYLGSFIWGFDEAWEKVPGQWMLTVASDDDVLAAETFEVH